MLASPAWAAFREAWRKLDEQPSEGADHAAVGALVERCRGELERLEPAARALDPALVGALQRLVEIRGQVLLGLERRLMVMHRMPFPGEQATAHAGGALEQRLDALRELRARQGLGSEAYRAALDAALGRALLLVALQPASKRDAGPALFGVETFADLEAALAGAAAADAGDGDAELRAAVAAVRRLAPLLGSLLADLER